MLANQTQVTDFEFEPFFSFDLKRGATGDARDCIVSINGKAYDLVDEEADEVSLAASFQVLQLNLSAANDHSLEVLDAHSATAQALSLFYNRRSGALSERVLNLVEVHDREAKDLLYFHRIEVLPEFRGRGLARRIVENVESLFGKGIAASALRYLPLQCELLLFESDHDTWRETMNYGEMEQDCDKAKRSLSGYYRSIGFRDFGKEELMLKPNPSYLCARQRDSRA